MTFAQALARIELAEKRRAHPKMIAMLSNVANTKAQELVRRHIEAGDPIGLIHACRTGSKLPVPISLGEQIRRERENF